MGDAAYQRRCRAKGLCPRCGKPTVPGRSYCRFHLEKQKLFRTPEDDRARRKSRKEQGKCIRCGAPMEPEMDRGRVKCLFCREMLNGYR